jgi:outer membrane protein TolC
MTRQFSIVSALAVLAIAGCTSSSPFYLYERDELAHYLDRATEIEYPDVYQPRLEEVDQAQAPITLSNPEFHESWELSLQEAIHTSLHNSKVIRNLGSVTPFGFADGLTGRTVGSTTVYDPAIFETDPQAGVEAALANFDAEFTTSVFWQKTDRPQNVNSASFDFIPVFYQQDQGQFEAAISKQSASGTRFTFRNQTIYDRNNRGFGRALPSDWYTALELEVNQPLLRGNGAQYNRIPVMLARINTDVSLAQFESSIRNLVMDIENTYWDLYTAYRNLEASKIARDSAQATWKIAFEKFKGKVETAQAEAQAQEQYFFFRAQVETAWRDLLNVETRLRWLMGLTTTDGRIIRPADEPVQARVEFDWHEIHEEALLRSTELRQQKWAIKRRELELLAARHQLLPEVNLVALYRWLGFGDDLAAANRRGQNFVAPGSMAWDELTEGNFQEVRLGLDFRPPRLGARREMAAVRNAQLQIARERARLEDMELNTTHLLTTAVRNLDYNRRQAQTHFNRWATAQKEVESATALYRAGKATLDLVLEAQRRRAQAQSDYYRALGEHTKSIADVHFRKGTLLPYNEIHLAEGPWPEKAYQDARERSRARSAGRYMDYGWIRPGFISKGPVNSDAPVVDPLEDTGPANQEGEPSPAIPPDDVLQTTPAGPGTPLPFFNPVELEEVKQPQPPMDPLGPQPRGLY